MYVLGAIEVLILYLAPAMSIGDKTNDARIYGSVLLILLTIVSFFGIRYVNRFAQAFLASVLIAIVAILAGLVSSNRSGLKTTEIVGFPGLFGDNFGSGFDEPDLTGAINPEQVDFYRLFAIFFPSVTGIMAGSNRRYT
jgi:hypothetical protein